VALSVCAVVHFFFFNQGRKDPFLQNKINNFRFVHFLLVNSFFFFPTKSPTNFGSHSIENMLRTKFAQKLSILQTLLMVVYKEALRSANFSNPFHPLFPSIRRNYSPICPLYPTQLLTNMSDQF
jgi:hypothetical protein